MCWPILCLCRPFCILKYYSQCVKIFIRNRLLLLFKGTVAYYVFFSFFFSCRLIRFLNFFIFFFDSKYQEKNAKKFHQLLTKECRYSVSEVHYIATFKKKKRKIFVLKASH